MTTNSTHENTSAGTEALSGQTKGLDTRDDSTSLATLQHRVGHIRLKARLPGACIALEIPGPVRAELLTLDEARQLRDALAELIEDLEADARARDWSRHRAIIAEADASSESYHSLP